MPDYRKRKKLVINRTVDGKYRLLLMQGKGGRILGNDMDTKEEAERRKRAYAQTYGY